MLRRDFLNKSLATVSFYSCLHPYLALQAKQQEPHYFIMFTITGGWEPSYMFDARPLEMTANNVIHNFTGEEPAEWTGSNGQATLANSIVYPLKEVRSDFSILNGVLMETGFDGHEQNYNYMFTGNPFGADAVLPKLTSESKREKKLLAGLKLNSFFNYPNTSTVLPVSTGDGQGLSQMIKESKDIYQNKMVFESLKRIYGNSKGKGQMSLAKDRLLSALNLSPEALKKLNQVEYQEVPSQTTEKNTLDMISAYFKSGLTNLAVIEVDVSSHLPPDTLFGIDSHSVDLARLQPTYCKAIVQSIKNYIKALKNINIDKKNSMYDVTTFMFASEFSRTTRTMAQPDIDVSQTGTDHNPLNNSLIVGGKGIKGGLVLGESDMRSSSEVLSPIHIGKDSKKLKIMGKRFDFANSKPIQELDQDFKLNEYMTMNSVNNTLMSLFGVPNSHYLKNSNDRMATPAPIINGLLT